jgi:hypothetical protein
MKKLLLLLFVTTLFNVNAQKKLKETDTINLKTVTVEQLKKKFKNGFETKVLILEDGSVIQQGSDLIVGVPSNNMNVNTNVYNGQKVAPTTIDFSYLMIGRYSTMAVLSATYFGSNFSDTEIVVEKIKIFSSGKNITAFVDFTKKDGTNTAMGKYGSILGLTTALNKGEIINPNRPMNRQEAIAKLKEAKDLLDLGMMSEDDFEKLKAELQNIIMNN